MKIRSESKVGEPIVVEEKVILPVMKVGFWIDEGKENFTRCFGFISPFALVIVDTEGERVISLTEEDFTLEYLKDLIPNLSEKIEDCIRKEEL